jgi:hypothetical protein
MNGSTAIRNVIVVVVSFAAFVGSAGCAHNVKAYGGAKLPPREVVTVYNFREISVIGVDGKRGELYDAEPGSPIKVKSVQITPGEHRLYVQYERADFLRNTVDRSFGAITFLYNFEPGKQYTFAVSTQQGPQGARAEGGVGSWMAMLVDKSTGKTVAMPETARAPHPIPSVSRGGTIVTGQTSTEMAGHRLILVPKTEQTVAYAKKMRSGATTFSAPESVKKPRWSTMPYGLGYFELTGVEPGEYLVLLDVFNHGRMSDWGSVTVPPGAAHAEAKPTPRPGARL